MSNIIHKQDKKTIIDDDIDTVTLQEFKWMVKRSLIDGAKEHSKLISDINYQKKDNLDELIKKFNYLKSLSEQIMEIIETFISQSELLDAGFNAKGRPPKTELKKLAKSIFLKKIDEGKPVSGQHLHDLMKKSLKACGENPETAPKPRTCNNYINQFKKEMRII